MIEAVGNTLLGYPPIVYFLMHELPFRGERFDQENWMDGRDCSGLSDGKCQTKLANCPRGSMVRSLTRRHLIEGETTREHVHTLLGKADVTQEVNGQVCSTYELGMCSRLGIDYDYLYICFDAQNRVGHVYHQQH